ncbi:S-layer homology domain-containing protein [Cohnella fermenti]|uniref:S-layer homology domain-containing protein n=1 Tax=Cohnella fermenti TaxID=2565925 RepID=UPI001454CDF5|nr:S-layer homology domain-containing protein [Cohnella fermenti]
MRQRIITYMLMIAMTVPMFAGTSAASVSAATDDDRLKIMSFNVLTSENQTIELEHDGQSRGQMLAALVDEKQPDSMGLNEVTQAWMNYLTGSLVAYDYRNGAQYAVTGNKAEDGATNLVSGYSEYSPILYRSDRYEIEKTGGYWFSDTPGVSTSKYADILDAQNNVLYKGMSKPRVLSYAVLRYKGTDEVAYIHVNSHFDHQASDYIQRLCAIQVKNTADELAAIYHVPVVLTGDINSTEQSEAYRYLANGENGYLNAKYVSDDYSTLPSSAGFGESYNANETSVIDHIFVSAGNVGVYKHDIIKNQYLSDHSAVYAELSLNQMPKFDSIAINNEPVSGFSASRFAYELFVSDSDLILDLNHNSGYAVTASLNGESYPVSAEAEGQSGLELNLEDDTNTLLLYVSDSAGRTTTYTLTVTQESGEAKPVISEIFPNASPGFNYFEVTNVGTKSLSTDDYAFLWGNIGGDASVSWEGVLELPESRIIRPGASVVVWFTYNADNVFAQEPTVADFNAHYYTSLTDENVIILGTSQKFIGYSVSSTDASQTATFTMGANKDRGMRIAYAKDSEDQPYGWTKKTTNSSFNGPTASVSSYKSISATNLTQRQLFKFKYVEGQKIAAASDVTDASYASPGVYDTRIGNEPKDAYARIEAGEYDTYYLVHAEGDNLGGSLANSWAFYSNVQFGETGAESVTFSAAVKQSNASGTIDIYIDGTSDGSIANARRIGSLATTPTAADWSVYREFETAFSERITGTHHVTLVFTPNSGKTYVGNLDYFVFHPYVVKADLSEVTGFTFQLDGEPLTEAAALNATREHTTYTLSAEAVYSPLDADFTIKWSSSNPAVATISETTGVINVLKYGEFTVQAAIYSNYELFDSYTSPPLSTNYKISAFSNIEGEWASAFTPGASKTPNAKKATAATGMSDNLTNGYNYIGDVVDGSSMTIAAVDFGANGIQGVTMNMALKLTSSGGAVTLYADSVDEANKIGSVTASVYEDTPDNYNTYLPYAGVIDNSVTGVHDLILAFSTSRTYVGNIDYLIFEEKEAVSPPEEDTVKPVITLLGDATVNVANGAAYADAGATASDDRDGEITDRLVTTITLGDALVAAVNTGVAGTYLYHYNVQDTAGNAAAEAIRTVIVAAPTNNSGGGDNPTTAAPSAPSSESEQPAGTQQLSREDLKPEGAGGYKAQWSQEKDTLLLPADVAGIVEGDGTLKLSRDRIALELSGQALRELLAGAGEGAQQALIRITAAAVDSGLVRQAMDKATVPGAVQWTAAGEAYSIEVEVVDQNGDTLVASSPLDKAKITLSIRPGGTADPELLGIYAVEADGTLVYMGGQWKDGEIAAEVPRGGQYAVLAYTRSFEDVDDNYWAKTVIVRMAAKHVIEGVDDARFEPQGAVTRAEFAAMLVRLLGIGQPADVGAAVEFADVRHDSWYADAVEAAAQAGLVAGRSDGEFDPQGVVTRQEMAVMVVRAYEFKAGHPPTGATISEFTDADQVGAWAREAVAAAGAADLLRGRGDGQFAPQDSLTRAESVQVLYNLLNSLK